MKEGTHSILPDKFKKNMLCIHPFHKKKNLPKDLHKIKATGYIYIYKSIDECETRLYQTLWHDDVASKLT